MQTATQLANLRPFVPNDPRIKAGPGRPPGIRKKIQRFLDAPGGTVNGEQLTMEERGILETMIKMTGGVAGKPVSEMAQLRAFDLIMCRRYGKPEQPIKQSGSLDLHHTFTGKRWEELSKDELTHVIANPDKYREQDGMLLAIPEAEYEVIESINSTEAGTNNITVVPSED